MTATRPLTPIHTDRISAISFDLDDTLWPVAPVIVQAEKTLNQWLNQSYPRLGETLSADQQLQIRNSVRLDNPHLAHNLTETRRLGIKACLQHVGYNDEHASHEAMAVFLEARNQVTPFDDVSHALTRLSTRYPLIALSNGNANIFQTSLSEFFAAGISAEQVGASKPHPSMFEHAADAAGCSVDALLHIGDHPSEDIEGALTMDCQAILISRFEKPHNLGDRVPIATELGQVCNWLQV